MKKRSPRRRKKQSPTPEQFEASLEQLYEDAQELWSLELLGLEKTHWPQLTAVHFQLCKLEELAYLSGVTL